MKFGRQLECTELPKFRGNYIQYKELKKALKVYTGQEKDNATVEEVTHWASSFLRLGPNPEIAASPEARLNEVLTRELERVSRVVELEQAAINTNLTALLQDANRARGDLAALTARMQALGDDIVNLKSFSQMNFTGFRKILKKYDKWSKKSTMAWYMPQVVKAPLMTSDYDGLLTSLNTIARKLKELGRETNGQPAREVTRMRTQEIGPPSGSRELVLLVDVKDTMRVRVQLAMDMQIQSTSPTAVGKTSRSKTVSVFFDTPDLDNYSARIMGMPARDDEGISQGAPSSSTHLRRNDASQLVSVVYQEEGGSDDKRTEMLLSKADTLKLLQLQAGQAFQSASAPGAAAVLGAVPPADSRIAMQAAQQAQRHFSHGLQPMAQASYIRNILKDDSGVIVVLDEDIRLAKCKDWQQAAGASDHFPYNVLSVFYPPGVSTAEPRWLRTIYDNGNLLQVAGFTKAAHAIARFHGLGNGLPVPHWYHNVVGSGQLDEENDGPPSHEPSEGSASGKANTIAEDARGRAWTEHSARLLHEFGTTPQFEDELTATRMALARGSADQSLPGAAPASAGNDLSAPLLARAAPEEAEPTFFQRLFGQDGKSELDKPVRRAIVAVQPKTLYSNERTFLEWIHFATIIAAAGVLMLHATGEAAHVMIGRLLILASIFLIMWSMHVFNWRADGLDFKVDMRYADNVGPVALVFSVLAALAFSTMHAVGLIA
mmetsp:Transcript_34617/g.62766  ORF Transcript_34617/g.62766 Transcript_34617/m.62766 type:complete len:717 (-) Transcript_34617:159-2309(-)|eukprot:CAMPEP_0197663202 /NCGR_PEP_ID=MMETSP1338-20131121/56480_1 /TAXON_ID=43686 ORGANISM="Pelagodinium beii, Strain RCC1491" /NCGR_SAMPLE_ID=MMETSP1338 /ASSEMBLY_ACC=CAM_ASM_000754 /LENGTH=716 /DNA_ID=CAMNT_0043241455 /DNA_START=127 /DNA_END=2277 /DNA_ORIENTATION=+